MKKAASILLASILLLTLPLGVMAASQQTQSTVLSLDYTKDHDYVVVIPSVTPIYEGGTDVPIEVTELSLPEGERLRVFAAGAVLDESNRQIMKLMNGTGDTIYYTITGTGTRGPLNGANENHQLNWLDSAVKELATFTEAGIKTYNVYPQIKVDHETGQYTGNFTYGFEILPA